MARFLGGGRGGGAVSGGARSAGGRRRQRGYDIVVLDECSQIVEPMSLLPIAVARPSRLVLVGDPMQLPPPVAHAKVRLGFVFVRVVRERVLYSHRCELFS